MNGAIRGRRHACRAWDAGIVTALKLLLAAAAAPGKDAHPADSADRAPDDPRDGRQSPWRAAILLRADRD